jgi:hypothetical protein
MLVLDLLRRGRSHESDRDSCSLVGDAEIVVRLVSRNLDDVLSAVPKRSLRRRPESHLGGRSAILSLGGIHLNPDNGSMMGKPGPNVPGSDVLGKINQEIVTLINSLGGRAVGLSG